MSAEERVYTINLGKVKLSQSQHRAVRAVNMVREFASRHMGGSAVKIDEDLAHQIWERGARSPPRRIRVRMWLGESGEVIVSKYDEAEEPEKKFAEVPAAIDDAEPAADAEPQAPAGEDGPAEPDAPKDAGAPAEPEAQEPKPDLPKDAEPAAAPDAEPKPDLPKDAGAPAEAEPQAPAGAQDGPAEPEADAPKDKKE